MKIPPCFSSFPDYRCFNTASRINQRVGRQATQLVSAWSSILHSECSRHQPRGRHNNYDVHRLELPVSIVINNITPGFVEIIRNVLEIDRVETIPICVAPKIPLIFQHGTHATQADCPVSNKHIRRNRILMWLSASSRSETMTTRHK